MDHHVLTALPGRRRLPLLAPVPGTGSGSRRGCRFLALREFRSKLYACLTARADALFELTDAILCADHAVTSLVQQSLARSSAAATGRCMPRWRPGGSMRRPSPRCSPARCRSSA